MPAYVSASVIVKDPNKLKTYLGGLPATLQPFGGKPVARGKVSQVLHGSNDALAKVKSPKSQRWRSEPTRRVKSLRGQKKQGDSPQAEPRSPPRNKGVRIDVRKMSPSVPSNNKSPRASSQNFYRGQQGIR